MCDLISCEPELALACAETLRGAELLPMLLTSVGPGAHSRSEVVRPRRPIEAEVALWDRTDLYDLVRNEIHDTTDHPRLSK